MSQKALNTYLRDIEEAYRKGNATEHTYRSYFKTLIETAAPHVIATNEPKHIKNCGAPDFIITAQQTPLGYVETKDIGISLSNVEHTDQMKRYLAGLANLILTDYVEFRWYVTGQHRTTARLAKPSKKGKWIVDADGLEQVSHLMQDFITTQAPTVNNPKELATRMASIAQLIRNAISLSFKSETGAGSLHGQFEGFRQVLLPDLTAEQFADMYAQTICYGLFAARVNTPPKIAFRRELAAYDIPRTNPFLRKMFGYIAGPDLDERVVWAVDDLAEVLNRTDMESILRDFGKRTRQEDPVVHFYETFLAEYDPKMREARGVYYTPEPVVSYIVRSVDYLLKKDFDLPDGLADATKISRKTADGKSSIETHKVQILDPATGTGTFLHSVIDNIYETFRGNKGMWSSYVSQHLLPRIFGFELLMAPYAVAHMKLGLQLKETGYDFKGQERLGVYLTNTLEEGFGEGNKLPFVEWLVEEATAAGGIKHDAPVMVVLGNPPYSNFGKMNRRDWILNLLKEYKKDLKEKKLNLDDDFIKFIRFGQWRINQTGYGILAFITNNTYINGITHRRMRQSLMETFSDIYILDLHGSAKKKEKGPDGSKDENVFDIQQGVSISIFVKKPNKRELANVYHFGLWGVRELKYGYLLNEDLKGTYWTKLEPKAPEFFFIPDYRSISSISDEYKSFVGLNEIFFDGVSGIQTGRDEFVSSVSRLDFNQRIDLLSDKNVLDVEIAEQNNLPIWNGFNLHDLRQKLQNNSDRSLLLYDWLYRPFDVRPLLFDTTCIKRPRGEIMEQLLKPNKALISVRQQAVTGFQHVFVTSHMGDGNTISLNTREYNYYFPLYIYPKDVKDTLFTNYEISYGRKANLASPFTSNFAEKLHMQFLLDSKGDLRQTFGPEDIFSYIYAITYSPTYRIRYAEYLKIDFLRLPLTSNADLFGQLCKLGECLVGLHLMGRHGTALPMYPEEGNDKVEKIEYRAVRDQPGRVYINKTQYFEGVPSEVWNFYIGGYQVCYKWLKDRKERALSYEDIKHYQRIVAALAETIILMEQIDEAIEDQGGWPIE